MTNREILNDALNDAEPYLQQGDTAQAFAAFTQWLRRYPQTENHSGVKLGFMQMMSGYLDTPEKMRTYLKGFN